MARRSEYAEQVGEWIAARRAQLGMTQAQLAEAVGGSIRTVTNIESGATAVMQLSRPAWEQVLGWPPGSLTAAYRRGQHPTTRPAAAEADAERLRILTRAGIPAELHRDRDVRDVLDAGLPPDAQVQILRLWHTSRVAYGEYVRMLGDMRDRRRAQ